MKIVIKSLLVVLFFLNGEALFAAKNEVKETKEVKKEVVKKKRTKKDKGNLEEVTLTGKLIKKEIVTKKKTKKTYYYLVLKNGKKASVSKPKYTKKEKAKVDKVINLDDFIGSEVVIIGMGRAESKGRKKAGISKIKSIKKVIKENIEKVVEKTTDKE